MLLLDACLLRHPEKWVELVSDPGGKDRWCFGAVPAFRPGPLLKSYRKIGNAFFFISLCILSSGGGLGQSSVATQISRAVKPPTANPSPSPESSPPMAVSPPEQAIPLPQVADQAEQLDRRLEEIANSLHIKTDLLAPNQALGAEAAEIKERALHVDAFLHSSPDMLQLRDEIVYWRALSHQSAEQRRQLTARADELQAEITYLNQEETRWQATRDQIQDTAGIEVVAARAQQELDSIRAIRTQAQEQLNQILTLQNGLSRTGRQVSEALAKLTDAEILFRGHLFERDSQTLWAPRALREEDQPIRSMMRRSADQDVATASEFFRVNAFGLLSIPCLYLLGVFGAFRLKRYLGSGAIQGLPPETDALLARPYSIALVITLILSIPQVDSAPVSITLFYYLLWLGLVFQFAPLLMGRRVRSLVYSVLALTVVELVRVAIPFSTRVNRLLLAIILAAALVSLGWQTRHFWPSRLQLSELRARKASTLVLQLGMGIALLLLAIALPANILGFVALSHVLGIGTLLSGFLAAALYCTTRILLIFLLIFLQSPWANAFTEIVRQQIKIWGRRALIAGAIWLWWTHSELYIFVIQDSFVLTVANVMSYSFGLGKVEFTIGNIVGVVLIVGFGYLLSKGSSSLLRTVLVAKLPFQRGLPYAISKVTYYCLMMLVFFAAITRAGVDLNKFTVVTGALGIGVGFGLQNIVNNFASGLILLFERPIRVGDVVEVNGLSGTVKRIGARSSTIATAQGAEVIVPNNSLIANQVVNWTLSSPWRRVDIPVGVAYGSDPDTVLRLLTGVASGHDGVMPDPPPAAFFLGFGDSALNFELRFWANRQDIWFQLKSDVSIGVAQALRDANIEVPFPQRDLHLRSMDTSIAEQTKAVQQALSARPDLPPKGTSGRNAPPQ
jgi:potassium efflux system protein